VASDPTIPFSPTAPEAAAIRADLLRDDLSFSALAALYNTTSEALALWLAKPEIVERIAATDSMVCYRNRIIATGHIPTALRACVRIIEDFVASRTRGDSNKTPSAEGRDSPSLSAELLHHRITETARKAAAIIARFTRQQRTPGPNWDPAFRQLAQTTNEPQATEPSPASALPAAPAPSAAPASSSSTSVEELALAAALKLAGEIDPSKDPYEVLEDIINQQEAIEATARSQTREPQSPSTASPAATPLTLPRPGTEKGPGQRPEAQRSIKNQPTRQIPIRNLWRRTPGAAHPP
jgi:hypothetical protein